MQVRPTTEEDRPAPGVGDQTGSAQKNYDQDLQGTVKTEAVDQLAQGKETGENPEISGGQNQGCAYAPVLRR